MSERFHPNKLRRWYLTTMALRGAVYLLHHWPLILICALVFSPITLHMRIQYEYYPRPGGEKSMIDCRYLGPRGWVRTTFGDRCPFIAMIDVRDFR